MQKLMCTGRVTRDLELRYSQNNEAIVIIPVAILNNNKEAKPLFLDFIVYGNVAKQHAQYLGKGSLVNIEGHIYQTVRENNGKKVRNNNYYADKIEYLSMKKAEQQNVELEQKEEPQVQDDPFASFGEEIVINPEDLPF